MIDFACRKIDLEEIFICTFSINRTAYRILRVLSRSRKALTIEEISKLLNKDRTTIQKTIKQLLEKDLIERKQLNKSKGGYVYYYYVKNKEEIKKRVKNIIGEWTKNVDRALAFW